MLSVEELRIHLSMGQSLAARGSMHIVNSSTHRQLKDALDYYLDNYIVFVNGYDYLEYTPGYKMSLDLWEGRNKACL